MLTSRRRRGSSATASMSNVTHLHAPPAHAVSHRTRAILTAVQRRWRCSAAPKRCNTRPPSHAELPPPPISPAPPSPRAVMAPRASHHPSGRTLCQRPMVRAVRRIARRPHGAGVGRTVRRAWGCMLPTQPPISLHRTPGASAFGAAPGRHGGQHGIQDRARLQGRGPHTGGHHDRLVGWQRW